MCQSAEMTSAKEENDLDSIPWENGDLQQKEHRRMLSFSVQASFMFAFMDGPARFMTLRSYVHRIHILCYYITKW